MSPLCSNCHKTPSMIFGPKNINIHCICGYNDSLPYNKYLQQVEGFLPSCMDHLEKKAHKYCINCKKWLCEICLKIDEHKEHKLSSEENEMSFLLCKEHSKGNTHYCPNCMEYLCIDCVKQHKSNHDCVLLNEIFSEGEMKEFIKKFKEGEQYLTIYYKKIKEDFIKKLESAFNLSQTKNYNILQTFRLLISNYIPKQTNDFYLLNNLAINKNIHLRKFYDNKDNIIEFFQNNIILKRPKKENKLRPNFDIHQIIQCKKIEEKSEINYILSLQDERIAVCTFDGIINIYNPRNNYSLDFFLKGHKDSVKHLAQMDINTLISCSFDNTFRIWKIDKNKGEEVAVITKHQNPVSKFVILPFNRIASAAGEKKIKIWSSKSPFHCIEILYGRVSVVLFLSQNKYLISGDCDKDTSHIHIWDINTYESKSIIENIFYASNNSIADLGGDRIIVGGVNGKMTIINILEGKITHIIENGDIGRIICFLLMKNGHLLCGSYKGAIYEYEMNEYALVKKREKIHEEGLTYFVNCEKSKIISCNSKQLTIWKQERIEKSDNENNSIDSSKSLENSTFLYIQELKAIQKINEIQEHTNGINSLLLLNDGRIASCSDDSTIKIFNPKKNYKLDFTISGNNNEKINYITQLENGDLVSCSDVIQVYTLDSKSFQLKATLGGNEKQKVNKIIPLPADRMVSCSSNNSITFWYSKAPYDQIKKFEEHNASVFSIILLNDNKRIISGSSDSTLKIWNINYYHFLNVIHDVQCSYNNSLIQIDEFRIAVGNWNYIIVVSIEKAEILKTIKDVDVGDFFCFLPLENGNLLCGCSEGVLCEYDMNDYRRVNLKENCHDTDICALVIINHKLFASCAYRTIRIWK